MIVRQILLSSGMFLFSFFVEYIAKVKIMQFDVVFLLLLKVCKTVDGSGHW